MLKIYGVIRRYIMLFTHNNRYLPLTCSLTNFRYLYYLLKKNIVNLISLYHEIFQAKKFMKFYNVTADTA